MDPGFGVEVTWDEPQLAEGYPWVHPPNRALHPGVDRFFGLFNPGLWNLIRQGKFDAMFVSGYFYASAWIAILACRWNGVPVIFTTDGHNLRTWATQSRWKQRFKKFLGTANLLARANRFGRVFRNHRIIWKASGRAAGSNSP